LHQQNLEDLEHLQECLLAPAPDIEARELDIEAQAPDLELGSFPVDSLVLPQNHLVDFWRDILYGKGVIEMASSLFERTSTHHQQYLPIVHQQHLGYL